MNSFEHYINNIENDYCKLDDDTKKHFKQLYDKYKQKIIDDKLSVDRYFNVECYNKISDECYFNFYCFDCMNIRNNSSDIDISISFFNIY